jgi:hypothetical protein
MSKAPAKKIQPVTAPSRIQPLTQKQMSLSKGVDGDEEGDDGDADEDDKESPFQKGGVPPQFQKQDKEDGDDGDKGDDSGDKDDDKGGSKVEIEVKKSDVTGTDLDKSIARLNEFTEQNDPGSRKVALLSKAQTGELSKSEKDELFQILGGAVVEKSDKLSEKVTKGLTGNDDLQKALDVSDYLKAQHDELCKSLTVLSDSVEKGGKRQGEFNILLAKAVSDVAMVAKSIGERLGTIETQPARAPKSKGVSGGAPLQKGFGGRGPAVDGEELSKSQILDGLDLLMEKSADGLVNGESVMMAVAKYEQLSQISKSMLGEVQKVLKDGQSAAH